MTTEPTFSVFYYLIIIFKNSTLQILKLSMIGLQLTLPIQTPITQIPLFDYFVPVSENLLKYVQQMIITFNFFKHFHFSVHI